MYKIQRYNNMNKFLGILLYLALRLVAKTTYKNNAFKFALAKLGSSL